MPLTTSSFIACLEDYMFQTPEGARSVVPLSFEGVRGRRTDIATPYTNIVGVTGPQVEVPDASIDAVIEEFRGVAAPFGWLVGPHSPAGLKARLEQKGLVRIEEFCGLVLNDLHRKIDVPSDVTVRELGGDEQDLFSDVLSKAFGLPPEMVSFLCEIIYFAESGVKARNYLASVDGTDGPVAAATTVCDQHAPIAILAGSAVFEDFRGRGIYRALVQKRLIDIREEGIEALVIQAVRSTSAPICRSLGFEEVCAQELYMWSPGE